MLYPTISVLPLQELEHLSSPQPPSPMGTLTPKSEPKSSFNSIIIYVLLFCLTTLATSKGRTKANDLFSWAINVRIRINSLRGFCLTYYQQFLLYQQPIRSVDSERSIPVPTLSYRFPNGQGDAAKFLHGEANSNTWAQKYGRLYRVWNGTRSEMYV